MITKRMLAFARSIERLSSRDMDRVLTATFPQRPGYPVERSERYTLMVRLLDLAQELESEAQQP